jgi:hypothetical protein
MMISMDFKEKSSQSFDSFKTLRDEKNLWFVSWFAKEIK